MQTPTTVGPVQTKYDMRTHSVVGERVILQIKSLKYMNVLAASITRGEMHYTVHRDDVTVPNIYRYTPYIILVVGVIARAVCV